MAIDENSDKQNQAIAQKQRFIEAARELECDEDEAHWDERLKKVVKQKPENSKP